jgi:tRNA(Ile)-lysidine synthase
MNKKLKTQMSMYSKIYTKFLTNIDRLQPFETYPHIAVALSGGVDSMTLVVLTKKWLEQIGGGQLTAITIDHHLRAESSEESREVGKICENLNIKHQILHWRHNGVTNNIQAKAREARYKLLTEYCNNKDILHLFIGQHSEDKIENFFIKLSRASGIFGLIDSEQNFINNIRICKPLFNFSKQECLEILKIENIAHVDDPSNHKMNYFRNEIRHNLKGLFNSKFISSELFQQRIIESQDNLRSNAALIQELLVEAFCESITISPLGFAKIKLDRFKTYNHDIQNYLLTYIIIIVSGKILPPRAEQIQILLANIISKNFRATTLNTCIIDSIGQEIIIFKELNKIQTKNLKLSTSNLWDERFNINTNQIDSDLTVGHLDLQNYQRIKKKLNFAPLLDADKHRYKILFTIPAIKRLEKVVAMPNIDYYEELSKQTVTSIFEPQYISKALHLKIKND